MNTDKKIMIMVLAVLAIILLGELLVYAAPAKYSANVNYVDGTLDYSLSSNGSDSYSLIVNDNGDFQHIEKYYIFFDDRYPDKIDSSKMTTIGGILPHEYYVDQLMKTLKNKGIESIEILDADELRAELTADIDSTCTSKGLIIVSGAMPDTIYTGKSTDVIFEWVHGGGSLYWAGNLIGCYYATQDEIVTVSDYQNLFFGSECLNTEDINKVYNDITENEYRYALSLSSNSVLYGVDTSKLKSTEYLSLGYTDGTYSSITLLKSGDGMMCIVAGNYTDYQRYDLSQIISSGICYSSKIIERIDGSVIRTTVSGTINLPEKGTNYSTYIYYGGYFVSFGRTFFNDLP